MSTDPGCGGGAEGLWWEVLFHQAWLPMARVDPAGRIVEGNAALGRLAGRGIAELRGLRVRELVAPGGSAGFGKQWRDVVDGRRSRGRGRVLVVRGDGRLLLAEAVAWPVRGAAGRVIEVVCSLNPVNALDGMSAGARETGDPLTLPVGLRLSQPEARMLEGLAEGLGNAALGARLYLSKAGVDYYLDRLRKKFRVRGRCALVARAYALGVLMVAVWPPRVDSAYVERP
ncbi:hypothetical protein GCM10009839_27720 [Catenulispora yoronensis]|uniref:HTH luxR-type domain-containing protein n=1 Tax=Catenulispora yoronensis TaxID=450799 RepID=A0ABP5FIS5_9ACTN